MKVKSNRHEVREFVGSIQEYLERKYGLKSQREFGLGKTMWKSKADIFIDLDEVKLFVEVEGRQPHPDTNVTKYWHWIEKEKIKGKVVLIHVFGAEFYNNNYRSRSELCGFIANKISKSGVDFSYYSIPVEKQHQYSKGWKIHSLLDQTIKQIEKFL